MKRDLVFFALATVAACGRDASTAANRNPAAAVAGYDLTASSAPRAALRMPAPMPIAPAEAAQAAAPIGPVQPPSIGGSAMLVRTGQISIEVRKVDSAMTSVRAAAASVGGYVTDVSITAGRDETPSATLTAKVPGARYDDMLRQLREIGTVESSQTSVEDVGEEYVDVSALLANDRRLEQRLLDLLSRRTGKLQDVLDVERELARVRGEMDRYEGRLRYLTSHAAMSTIAATVHERMPLVAESGARNPFALAFTQARRNFVESLALFISALGVLVPIAALLLVGVAVFRFARRRLRPA